MLNTYFLTRQQIIRLAPTVMSLSSSIYKAMELKIRRREQVRTTSRLFYLTGSVEEEKASLPSIPRPRLCLPREADPQRASKWRVPCADAWVMPFLQPRRFKSDHGVLFLYKEKRWRQLGRGADKRFRFPFYFSNCGWIKEKLNWKDQFKNHRKKIEARPVFGVWCHICPRFWG